VWRAMLKGMSFGLKDSFTLHQSSVQGGNPDFPPRFSRNLFCLACPSKKVSAKDNSGPKTNIAVSSIDFLFCLLIEI
jgi:hypothetical protein